MAKTISVAELGHGGASRAIRAAQEGPVVVRKESRPAAWIVSAEKLARVVVARGAESAEAYQRVLELIAVELYGAGSLTMGQAAKLSGLALGDFIDLCGRLQVPVLWEPPGGIGADVERLSTVLEEAGSGA